MGAFTDVWREEQVAQKGHDMEKRKLLGKPYCPASTRLPLFVHTCSVSVIPQVPPWRERRQQESTSLQT